jgi:hypothetical protein
MIGSWHTRLGIRVASTCSQIELPEKRPPPGRRKSARHSESAVRAAPCLSNGSGDLSLREDARAPDDFQMTRVTSRDFALYDVAVLYMVEYNDSNSDGRQHFREKHNREQVSPVLGSHERNRRAAEGSIDQRNRYISLNISLL